MFTWVENEIITINPGKESKKVRDGKFQTNFRDPRTVRILGSLTFDIDNLGDRKRGRNVRLKYVFRLNNYL